MKHLNRKNLQFYLTSFAFIFCIYKIIHLVIITYHPLPWVDEWNTLNSFRSWKENGELFNILFAPHNEHRMVFPKLFYFLDYLIFDGSAKGTIALSISFFLLNSLIFFIAIRKYFPKQLPSSILGSCIILSGHQASNFIWSFQLQWSLFIFFLLLSIIYFLKFIESESRIIYFICFYISILIASFSSASGNILWVVVLLFSIYQHKKIHFQYFIFLFLSGFIFFLSYWHGIKLNLTNSDESFIFLSKIFNLILYYLAYLGGPMSFFGPYSGVFVGCLFLIIALYQIVNLYIRPEKNFLENFSFLILIFVLLNAGVVSIGRLELGLTQAVESIYSSVVLLGYAALWISFLPFKRAYLIYGVQFIILFSWFKLPYDYYPLKGIKEMATSAIYLNYYDAPELKTVGFNSKLINELKFLKINNLGIYKDLNSVPIANNDNFDNTIESLKTASFVLNVTNHGNDIYKIEGNFNSDIILNSHKILFIDRKNYIRGTGYFDSNSSISKFYGYLRSEDQNEFNLILFKDDLCNSYNLGNFEIEDLN